MAAGLVAAGVVTAHAVLGQLSASLGFLTTTLFFVGGSIFGFLHGGVLGYLGRPPETTRAEALRRLALAVAYAVPAMAVGWVVSMLMVVSVVSVASGRIATLVVSLPGWVAAAALLWWAVVETRAAARHLFRRWPDSRALLIVLALAFLALLPVFLVTRPSMWVVGVRPSATAASAMALVAALWIGGPLATLGLLGVRAWVDPTRWVGR